MTYTRTITVRKHFGDQQRTGTIEVTIDVDGIARQLARRAFFNKSKRSGYMAGAIVGKAHSVTDSDHQDGIGQVRR